MAGVNPKPLTIKKKNVRKAGAINVELKDVAESVLVDASRKRRPIECIVR